MPNILNVNICSKVKLSSLNFHKQILVFPEYMKTTILFKIDFHLYSIILYICTCFTNKTMLLFSNMKQLINNGIQNILINLDFSSIYCSSTTNLTLIKLSNNNHLPTL